MREVLSSRAVLRVSGADAGSFLQGLLTQNVLGVGEGEAVFAALLTPQGKVLFDFFLAPHADGFLADCDAASASALVKRLTIHRLRAKVVIEEAPDLSIALGDASSALLSFADPRLERLPRRSVVRRDDAAAADEDYDALRISLGVPEFNRDFSSDEVFLLDINYDALNAVSYQKGCFVGQEVSSRMKRKGEVRKRTLIARFTGEAPAKDAAILAGEAVIGEVLSGRGTQALALVRVDRLNAAATEGRPLTADGRGLQLAFPDYLKAV